MAVSPHLTNIPEAVRIASGAANADPELKQQAIDYLARVKELSGETWQDCLSLYLQGGGAGPSGTGKDGREKLPTEMRMFCEQVVDTALTKPERMNAAPQQAMYKALVEFVQVEWVEGQCEGGQSYLRNKLAYTIAHLFLEAYPNIVPSFLHPFFELLNPSDPQSSRASNLHPASLAVHLMSEIALEIHDSTIKSARIATSGRNLRDGLIRDAIRTSGDEKIAVEGMLRIVERGLGLVESGQNVPGWLDLVELSLRTLSTWTPWVELGVSLTPQTLAFYHRLLQQPIMSLRTVTTTILRTFIAKGTQDPAERLQILKALDVISLLDPLENSTQIASKDDTDMTAFRAGLAGVLQTYGSELIEYIENEDIPENLRGEAELMMDASFPLLLRFLSDRRSEIPLAVAPFVSDLLRMWKKLHASKLTGQVTLPNGKKEPPLRAPGAPLPIDRRQFLSLLLNVSVKQLAWPEDAEWEAPGGDEPDPDDEVATLRLMRTTLRSFIESISAMEVSLHTEVVAGIVASTLEALTARGPSAVPWQQVELAMHLVYTFGEVTKSNTRAAYFDLPPELPNAKTRGNIRRKESQADAVMSSGRSTPTSMNGDDPSDLSNGDKINYTQYPLTPLGQLLTLCMTSGIVNYPHPSVPLQYFEIAVRYAEFWRCKTGSVQPMLEAMLDQRGIHHPDEAVRRRCFYLLMRFVRDCRVDLEVDMVPPILNTMRDVMIIDDKLPTPDAPDDDLLERATSGKTYFSDQLYIFEAAGCLVYITKSDAQRQLSLLEAIAGPLMSGIGSGLQVYQQSPEDLQAILRVHHHLLALGNFAKGFPMASTDLPYQAPFKQMTEAMLQALGVMKTQRIIRDSSRYAFSQFVNAIGSTVAELVPQFVSAVVTEFEPSELIDFMIFLNLLMHRLKRNTFETMDMLLLPLLSRIFSVLQSPVNGTDDASIHRRLKDAYLQFFTALMNANLDGVFISERNKPEFENVLTALLKLANDYTDHVSARLAFSFFAKSVIAWGTSPAAASAPSVFADSAASGFSKAVANGTMAATNQHAIPKEERAAQALPGYENFIYQQLLPACFEVPARREFVFRSGQMVVYEIAILLRNSLTARGQEAIDYLRNELLPKLNCPQNMADQLIESLRTQQAKDFRKTFAEFIKAMKS